MVLPEGIVSTGYPAVEATSRKIGIEYDPWQRDLNRCILGKDRHGYYAADTVVMSIPRQVGKTYNVGALCFADCIINPGTTVVWTAHRFKVSRESFNEMRAWAKSSKLAPHIDYDEITTGAGNETIPFRNGSRIVFAARERGAIRGFTKVRRLILDEGQILTEAAMADLAPTMNQAENPQIIVMGTPPKPVDPGEVFTALRKAALEGESEGVLYVEFSAPADCDLGDWSAVAKANPSFPHRTSKRAMQRLRKLLTNDDDYRREALGIWDDDGTASIFGPGKWAACGSDAPPDVPVGVLAVAVSVDFDASGQAVPKFATVAAGAVDGESVWATPLEHRPGTDWVVRRVRELQDEHSVDVIIDRGGPGADLIRPLEDAGVRLQPVSTPEVLDACAGIYKAVQDGRFRHGGYPELDAAAAGAVRRDVGDRWAWGRKKSSSDISPLEAATLAVWGAELGGSVYDDDRGLLTL